MDSSSRLNFVLLGLHWQKMERKNRIWSKRRGKTSNLYFRRRNLLAIIIIITKKLMEGVMISMRTLQLMKWRLLMFWREPRKKSRPSSIPSIPTCVLGLSHRRELDSHATLESVWKRFVLLGVVIKRIKLFLWLMIINLFVSCHNRLGFKFQSVCWLLGTKLLP